jgi:4-amino-4-deoxy-L-arabinose transferase-like glycosyltransferase
MAAVNAMRRFVATDTWLLATVLLLAAAVRIWGIGFGLPLVQARPDEALVPNIAVKFFRGDLNPRFFDYPSFFMYVMGLLYVVFYLWGRLAGWFESPAHFVTNWGYHWTPYFMIGRWVSVTAGTLTALALYRLGVRLADRATGLLAAFFLALAFVHVRESHYATTDAPLVLLLMAAVLWLVRAWQSDRRRDYLLAGVLSGLATSTKYNAVLLGLPMVIVAGLRILDAPAGRRLAAARRSPLPLMALAATITGLATSPFILLDFEGFRRSLELLRAQMDVGMTPPELLGPGWRYHFTFSLRHGVGWPLLVAGLAGLGLLARRNWRAAAIVLSFPVAYYTVAARELNLFVRYMLPVVPFVCLGAAVAVRAAAARLAAPLRVREPVLAAVLAAALVAPSAISVVRFNTLLARTDSRLLAGEWLHAHARAGSTIFQSGSHYGQIQLEYQRYETWTWDYGELAFRHRGVLMERWPDWIVIQESAVPFAHAPEPVLARLPGAYELVHVVHVANPEDPRNRYDVQDAFFLPYAGFRNVRRPGPNLYIYRHLRAAAPDENDGF